MVWLKNTSLWQIKYSINKFPIISTERGILKQIINAVM